MIQLNYSPKCFLGGPGSSTQAIYDIWQGRSWIRIFCEGAWSYDRDPRPSRPTTTSCLPSWARRTSTSGAPIYRAQLEFFQQAIEQAGTLDQAKIADVMRTAHFKTVMSDDLFLTNQILDVSCYAGQIGQWQNGVPEVIDAGDKRTAAPIYPKPAWPAPAASRAKCSQT